MCLDYVTKTYKRKIKKYLYKGLEEIPLIEIGNRCTNPPGKVVKVIGTTGDVLIERDDHNGHNANGQAPTNYKWYWWVSRDRIEATGLTTGCRGTLIDKEKPMYAEEVSIHAIGDSWVTMYTSGFHGCETPEDARNWGKKVAKFLIEQIHTKGLQDGRVVYVGKKLTFIEEVKM